MNEYDFPLPRQRHQIWVFIHNESPRSAPFVNSRAFLKHFNITSTFSRHSDIPLTTQYLPSLYELTSTMYMENKRSEFGLSSFNAKVFFMQSNCNTASRREDYVKELMRYIHINSYGKCLRNKDFPKSSSLIIDNDFYAPELLRLMSSHKFVLAIENTVCNDYITEKFWRPLIAGSIPIYFGSPTIRDWAPNNKSAIYIEDFASPQALVHFLLNLDENDAEYYTYLNHKLNKGNPIRNERLKREFLRRPGGGIDFFEIIPHLECFVCGAIYNKTYWSKEKVANANHYYCPVPLVVPRMRTKPTMHETIWESKMKFAKCEAQVLDELFVRNVPFTKEILDNLVHKKPYCDAI